MIVYRDYGDSGNILTTIAIGKKYLSLWEKHSLPMWLKYCQRHDLGLIVFSEHLISQDHELWKKPTWQKLLIGEKIKEKFGAINNICYLDTDILINPYSPNIFNFHCEENISLVSLRNNLPFDYEETLRKIAFNRNTYYSSKYPLDSALFISLSNLYSFHNLPAQADEACMGLFVFNVNNFSTIMNEWFFKYNKEVFSITDGGDQTHLNYEIQNYGKVTWLDYRFQAIWSYEMSNKYPFLYYSNEDDILIKKCIHSSLMSNYFLHFAGSWHESKMWLLDGVSNSIDSEVSKRFYEYKDSKVSGVPVGSIYPTKYFF